MTPPEQLSLDLSLPIEHARDPETSADVISLTAVRKTKEAQRLRCTYEEILATVNHIRLDRGRPSPDRR